MNFWATVLSGVLVALLVCVCVCFFARVLSSIFWWFSGSILVISGFARVFLFFFFLGC